MNMIRVLFMIGLVAQSWHAIGATATLPPRPTELSTIDFASEWRKTSDPSFPKEAFKSFPKDTQSYMRESPGVSLDFMFFDLDWDGKDEIIVADPSASGSGGQAYFVLRKLGKAWKLIAEFQGGIILSALDPIKENPDGFYRITSYYRSGDTYQNSYDYQKGRYRLTGQVMIPRVISRSCWWDLFWERLNGFKEYGGKNGKYDYKHEPAGDCSDRGYR
jgi:hypothetical protein